MDLKRSITVATVLVTLSAAVAQPQQATPAAVSSNRAFAAEALGGTIGSALGIVIGLAVAKPDDCPTDDDVACTLRRLGVTGVIGVLGATIGTTIGGRLAGAEPSLAGAFLGATAGAALAIGAEHLITEEMDQPLSPVGAVVLFSATQGILAAAGSRLGARLSRR